MKIWIINHDAVPPSMGGLVRHYYFSKYLQKKGHKVKIFTASTIHNAGINMIRGKDNYLEKEVDGIEYTFLKAKDYKGNGIDRILNIFQFINIVKKLDKYFEKPDVIYASTPDIFSVYTAVKLARKLRVKVIVEVRDLWPESIVAYNSFSKKNLLIKFLYKLEKWIYKKADRLVFTMPGGKDYLIEKRLDKDVCLNKVYSINNGVDLDEFNFNKNNYIMNDIDLNNENFFKLLYTGSIRKSNKLEILLYALKEIEGKGIENIKLIIYGDGPKREFLENIVKEENLNVVFKGRVEKKYIAYILSKSDLNIVNGMKTEIGKKYGCSWNKLFEYMASGKPVLSNLEINYDLIKEYGFGIAKFFDSSEEYAEEILKFYYMPKGDYNQMCKNSLDAVLEYDYKNLTKELEKVINFT